MCFENVEKFDFCKLFLCTKMVLNGPPPPIPISGVSKSLLPGGRRIKEQKSIVDDFYEQSGKSPLPGGLTIKKRQDV